MLYRWSIVFAFATLAAVDLPQVSSSRPPQPMASKAFPSGETIPVMPVMMIDDANGQDQAAPPQPPKNGTTLSEESKLSLIRYVSGEFAKARKAIPGGKDGFIIYVDKPLNLEYLDRAVANHGAAINTGDNVQISSLEFHDNSIVVDLNGGGRPKKHWRDRIQIGVGGETMPTTTQPQDTQQQGPAGFQPGMGATIYIDFPKHVPDLSPNQLKEILTPFLDFNKVRSASVHWVDTLPTATQKAITERRAIIGMDRDEVVAAMGKPDRKVRERDTNGNDTEDWIYGHPPDKTIFVKFTSEKVSAIKQFPQ